MTAGAQVAERRSIRARAATDGLPVRRLLVGMILVQVVVLYAILHRDGWAYDDNLYLGLARRDGFTWSWLNSLYSGHWAPGFRAAFSVINGLMPLDHRWALVVSLALLAGSTYLLQRSVAILFDSEGLGLALAAVFGFSVLFVEPLLWVSAGLQYLPNTFAAIFCLYAYLRFQQERSSRWPVMAALVLAAAYLFFEKPAYVLVYLLLVRVLMQSPSLRPSAVARSLWRERAFWGALLGVTVLWAVLDNIAGGSQPLFAAHEPLSVWASYFRIMWVDIIVPTAVGVALPFSLSSGEKVLAIVLEVGVVALVVLSILRKPSAWRGWAGLAIAVFLTGFLLVQTRLPQVGLAQAESKRYMVDFAWLVPLFAAFALWPRRTLALRADWRPGRIRAPLLRGGPLWPAVALLAIYVGLAVTTAVTLRTEWGGGAALSWEANVERTLGQAQRSLVHPVLADAEVPKAVLQLPAVNLVSRVAPLYVPGVQVGGLMRGPLLMLDHGGVAHRAVVGFELGSGTVAQLLERRELTFTGAQHVSVHGDQACVTAGTASARVTRLVSAQPDSPVPYYLQMSATSTIDGGLQLFVDDGRGYPGVAGAAAHVATAPITSIAYLGNVAPHRLMLVVNPGTTLCVSSLEVVTLRPAQGARAL